jgi:predicted small integral membrane protein
MPARTGPGTLTRGCLSRQRRGGRLPFPTLMIAAIALGIVGVVAKGLMYLLIISFVIFLGALRCLLCGCDGDRGSTRPVST